MVPSFKLKTALSKEPLAEFVEAGTCNLNCGSSSVDRALAFQAKGREFESRLPLKIKVAGVAQG